MINKEIYILGAGGQARQVESILNAVNPKAKITAFLDKNDSNLIQYVHNLPVYSESILDGFKCEDIIILNGLGRPNRRKPIEKLISKGFSFMGLTHPKAFIGKYVNIGEGTIIQSGVQFTTDISVGRFALIDLSATIGHDVIIGDYTTVSTGVNIAGGAVVGHGTWVGSGSVIIENVRIGTNSVIGAGSVVTRDIAANRLAYGVPAKEIRSISDASDTLVKG
jgi:sugar O-acyltransferase (sialic acid O-acetyltransferase NeuD family)